MKKRKNKLTFTRTQSIALSFFFMILTGAFLLMLPVCSSEGIWTDFGTTLFTATSAACVTGLVVVDTYTHWSVLGKLIIITLIQIGGLGVITMGTLVAVAFHRNISLKSRNLLQESVNSMQVGGIIRLLRFVVRCTVVCEVAGAIPLTIYFIRQKMAFGKAVLYGLFHSVSAFCNAGFDLMGYKEQYTSFTSAVDSSLVNIPFFFLIVIGGLGFVVWQDLVKNKLHFRKYQFQTKLVLSVSAILIFGSAVLFFILEYNNTFAGLSMKGKIYAALFSSITARTAGFNTVDTGMLRDSSKFLTIILMFIGGSPGSTAGGIKTTTLAAIVIFIGTFLQRKQGANMFDRCISTDTIRKAATVFLLSFSIAVLGLMIISSVENMNFLDIMFEVFSAIGTAGMSTGITRDLGMVSRIVLIILMYLGRIGSMTFALAFSERRYIPKITYPEVDVPVG